MSAALAKLAAKPSATTTAASESEALKAAERQARTRGFGAAPLPANLPAGLIQRKCSACGGISGISGRCESCAREEKLGLPPIQSKLMVGSPDDPLEKEADQVADAVTEGTPAGGAPAITPVMAETQATEREDEPVQAKLRFVQRETVAEDEEEPIQAKTAGAARGAGALPGVAAPASSSLSGGGAPLPTAARAYFEPRFGRDLSHVRVHRDGHAATLARSLNARAFAHGGDIWFGAGEFDLGSHEGRRLVAHELTHTLQQGAGGAVRRKPMPGTATPAAPLVRVPMDGPSNPNEAAAEHHADAAGGHGGSPAGVGGPPSGAAPPDGAASLPADLARLLFYPSGGAPLATDARATHEAQLGHDLSHVRLHRGPEAERLAAALGARAFAYGADIWFGAGESPADAALIAHELAHVTQQAPRPLAAERPEAEAGPRLQAARRHYYSLPRLGKGTKGPGDRTHDYVQEILGKNPKNSGLFSEVPIPEGGALGGTGRADFLKTDTGNYFAVQFDNSGPKFLALEGKSKQNGAAITVTTHKANSAPLGKRGAGKLACKGSGLPDEQGICRVDGAPKTVTIADLKPNYEAETLFGSGQVDRYTTKVGALAGRVNTFAAASPALIAPAGSTWTVSASKMGPLDIPAEFEKPGAKSPVVMANLYVDDVQTRVAEESVLKIANHSNGLITYEYIPKHMLGGSAATGGTTPVTGSVTSAIGTAKTGLAGVKGKLTEEKPKRLAKTRRRSTPRPRLALKREKLEAKDEFKFSTWKTETFQPWQKTAEAATGGVGKKALTDPSTEAEKRMKAEATRQIAARTGVGAAAVPAGTAERTRELELVQHWVDHGEKYGRLRQIFGSAYVKIVGTYDRVKQAIEDKVAAARKRMAQKSGGSGGIKGAILKALKAIAGTLLGIFIRDVANRLVTAVEKGATIVLGNLFGEEKAAIDEQLKAIEEAEKAFKKMIADALEQKFGEQIKALEERIKLIEEAVDGIKKLGDLVNLVKWAYRIAQCGAPPLLGCILALVGSALAETILAAIVASCWFQREVAYPLVSALGPITRLPGEVAKLIADKVRDLLPDVAKPLIAEVELTPLASKPDDVDCDTGSKYNLDPSQVKLARMLESYDPDHVEALMKALKHLGVASDDPDPAATISDDDIARLKKLLDTYSKDQLEKMVEQTPAKPPLKGDTAKAADDLDAAMAAAAKGQAPGAAAGGLSDADKAREAAEVERRLKANPNILPPNSEGFAPGDMKPGESGFVFYVINGNTLRGGFARITVTQREGDKSMQATLHAGTRFYDSDGKLVSTSAADEVHDYTIKGEGPKQAPAAGGSKK